MISAEAETQGIALDAVDQAERIGHVDRQGQGATARAAAVGGSVLPLEVFLAAMLALLGGLIGGAAAYQMDWSIGLGIVVGAGVLMLVGLVFAFRSIARRGPKEHAEQVASETTAVGKWNAVWPKRAHRAPSTASKVNEHRAVRR